MHVFVSGGSGINGRLVIQELLDRGHTVTALIRNPSKFDMSHSHLTVVQGTPESEADVRKALSPPPDAVIITLSIARTSNSPFAPLISPETLFSSTTQVLINALKDLSLSPKIIVNSSQGVGESFHSLPMPMRAIFSHAKSMRTALKDHELMDKLVRESGFNFVLARPCLLGAGEAKEVKVWPDSGKGAPWMPTITRQSLARWIVDAAEKDEWDGQSPVLTN